MSVNSGGKRPQMQPQQANAGPLQGNDFHKVPLVHYFTDLPKNLTATLLPCKVNVYSVNATEIWLNLRYLSSNVQTLKKIALNFCGLPRKPELQNFRSNSDNSSIHLYFWPYVFCVDSYR